jgi:hypothetical protein
MTIVSVWREIKRLYLFVLPLRFSFLALLVIAFAFGISGQGYDIIASLAEDDPTGTAPPHTWQRFGYIVTIILMAMQIWYWSRQLVRIKPSEGGPHSEEYPRLAQWLPRILGALTFVIAIASLYRVARNYDVPEPVWELKKMAIYLVIALLAFLAFTILRRKFMAEESVDESSFRDRAPITKLMLIGTCALSLLFFLWATFWVQSTVEVGSATIVILAFGLLVPVGSVLVWLGIRGGVPIFTFFLLWAILISPLTDNHVVETIPADVDARPSVSTAFDQWFERLQAQHPPGPDGKYPVLLVATEGGGIRAAYWTAAVLTSLTDTVPSFSDHLFAISAVSGGALGSAVYDALLVRRGDYAVRLDEVDYTPQGAEHYSLRLAAKEMLSEDALAPTLAAMMQPDFAQRFVPFAFLPDRARALQGGWERAWRSTISTQGAPDDLFAGGFLAMLRGKERTLPSLFLNGTIVETGQRIIATNLRITDADNHQDLAKTVDLFGAIGADVSVSTAVNNSARFTYVAPAGTLLRAPRGTGGSPLKCDPGQRCEHVVDGGYFENSGSATVSDLLSTLAASKYAPRIQPHVIFIQFQMANPAPVTGEKFGNELLSPVRALLNVREAHADLATDELQRRVGTANYTTFNLVQTKAVFPLGWLLADRTRNLMDAQMGPESEQNGENVKRIALILAGLPPTVATLPPIGRDLVQELAVKGEKSPTFQE